jgi:hypothetical protein
VRPEAFTPAAIFTSIALFGLMRFPLVFLPFALIQMSNALVSMRRLSGYLLLEEQRDEVEDLGRPGERRRGAGGAGGGAGRAGAEQGRQLTHIEQGGRGHGGGKPPAQGKAASLRSWVCELLVAPVNQPVRWSL